MEDGGCVVCEADEVASGILAKGVTKDDPVVAAEGEGTADVARVADAVDVGDVAEGSDGGDDGWVGGRHGL